MNRWTLESLMFDAYYTVIKVMMFDLGM